MNDLNHLHYSAAYIVATLPLDVYAQLIKSVTFQPPIQNSILSPMNKYTEKRTITFLFPWSGPTLLLPTHLEHTQWSVGGLGWGAAWVAAPLIIPSISNLINLGVTRPPTCQRSAAYCNLLRDRRRWQEEEDKTRQMGTYTITELTGPLNYNFTLS